MEVQAKGSTGNDLFCPQVADFPPPWGRHPTFPSVSFSVIRSAWIKQTLLSPFQFWMLTLWTRGCVSTSSKACTNASNPGCTECMRAAQRANTSARVRAGALGSVMGGGVWIPQPGASSFTSLNFKIFICEIGMITFLWSHKFKLGNASRMFSIIKSNRFHVSGT